MIRNVMKFAVMLAAVVVGPNAGATESSYQLRYVVPVHCTLSYGTGTGSGASGDGAVGLGALQEYCNAARGYELIVHYTPGTLRGTVLIAGEERIVLDGSGSTIVDTSPIPRNRSRSLAAIPGANGFDTDRLDFEVVATT
jgi:hypothetical protein